MAPRQANQFFEWVTDHLGLVLNSPLVGAEKAYGLFGELATGSEISSSSAPVSYGFTGYLADVESGLNRTGFRLFDSRYAKWKSQDPIGFESLDLNYHRYVFNSPLIVTDPTGEAAFCAKFVCMAGKALFIDVPSYDYCL